MNKQEFVDGMKQHGLDNFVIHIKMDGSPTQVGKIENISIRHSQTSGESELAVDVTALNKQQIIDMFADKYPEEMKPYMETKRNIQ
jgi:hypothetical protein